jgi:hypothetical protein
VPLSAGTVQWKTYNFTVSFSGFDMAFLRLDDFTVPGFGLVASLVLPFKDEDASGDTSSTSVAGKGTKAKKLDVTTNIRFADERDLRALTRMAEAKTGGDGRVYTVTNRTANATGMRQVRFTGELTVTEQEDRRCWRISFSLLEHISVPERAEARQQPKPEQTPQNSGTSVAPPPESVADRQNTADKPRELSAMEKALKMLDTLIGDYDSGQNSKTGNA